MKRILPINTRFPQYRLLEETKRGRDKGQGRKCEMFNCSLIEPQSLAKVKERLGGTEDI
jgi:hypothetical protein